MLKQRVITAVLLLAVLIPSVLYPSVIPFGVASLILIACGAWEWSRLNGFGHGVAVGHGVLFATACACLWVFGGLNLPLRMLWTVGGAFWVLAGAWLLSRGAARWKLLPQALRLLGGLAVLLLAWLAVMQARAVGINYLLSVMVLVWVADIGAYFCGRTFGGKLFKRKLAPSISPGKTWEGVLGGAAGVVLLAVLWISLEKNGNLASRSLYTVLADNGRGYLVLCVLFLSAMSVVGDLVESLFKRLAGVKDSSGLLPGHGGILDRVDALLPTLPLALMLSSFGG